MYKKIVEKKDINELANLPIGRYQLVIDDYTFTILIQNKINDYYQAKIFDPRMGEIKLNTVSKEDDYKDIKAFITVYLDDQIIIDNEKFYRYETLGIKKDNYNNYDMKLYEIKNNEILNYKLEKLIDYLPIKEHQSEGYILVQIDGIDIPLAILQQTGAYVEDKKLSLFTIRNVPDWQKKIRFDVVALNDYLSFYHARANDINIIKLLKERINSVSNYTELFIDSDNLNDLAVLIQRLAYIARYNNQPYFTRNLPQKLQQGISQLPRYAPLINKLSHSLQLVAVTQLVSATQSIVMQLNNPNLADNERKILEDNLIVTWAAGLTNFSSQVLQPLLLKAAYRVEGKPSELGVFVNRVNAGITLATAGFDLYYAYIMPMRILVS
ncbi:MAG: hypothetical protein RAM36_06400 [Arsenophonus sp.]|nr:hypothetical protein [Arsenophonus sp.]